MLLMLDEHGNFLLAQIVTLGFTDDGPGTHAHKHNVHFYLSVEG